MWYGSNAVSATIPSITLTNCSSLEIFDQDGLTNLSNTGTTTNILMLVLAIKIPSQSSQASIDLGIGGSFPTGLPAADVLITQLNTNLNS